MSKKVPPEDMRIAEQSNTAKLELEIPVDVRSDLREAARHIDPDIDDEHRHEAVLVALLDHWIETHPDQYSGREPTTWIGDTNE